MSNVEDIKLVRGVDPDKLTSTPRRFQMSNMANLVVQLDMDSGQLGVDRLLRTRTYVSRLSGIGWDGSEFRRSGTTGLLGL